MQHIVPELDGDSHVVSQGGRTVRLRPGADYSGLTLSNLDLTGMTLSDTVFDGAVLENCRLAFTDFSRASCVGTVFDNCDLDDPAFFWVRLNGARFSNCRSTASRFTHCTLNGTMFTDSNLSEMRMISCSGRGTKFVAVDLKNGKLFRSKFIESEWVRVHAPHYTVTLTSFDDCLVDRTVYWNGLWMATTFEKTRFVCASMNEVGTFRLKMHDCSVHSSRLRFMRLKNADLDGTTFHRCAFEGVDLSTSSVEGTRFLIPSHSENTVWPEGHEPGTEPLPE